MNSRRVFVRARALYRLVQTDLRIRSTAVAALGSNSALRTSEFLQADAVRLCADHGKHLTRLKALRDAEHAAYRAVRRAQLIGVIR